jgi:hypothetical protein
VPNSRREQNAHDNSKKHSRQGEIKAIIPNEVVLRPAVSPRVRAAKRIKSLITG